MKFLKRLQEKTEGEKDRLVLIAAIFITLCIIFAWVCFEAYFHQGEKAKASATVQNAKEYMVESWRSIFAK